MAKSKKNKKVKGKGAKRPEVAVEAAPAVAVIEDAPRPARKPRAATSAKAVASKAAANGKSRMKPEVTARLMAQLRDEAESIELWKLKIAAATKRRDALIVRIADRGVSEREIARSAKVTGPRVNQIYHGTGNGSKTTNNGD